MNQKKKTDLQEALDQTKGSFYSVGFFSMFINMLMIAPAIYMLQVYDRVVSSGSESTLLMVTLILVLLLSTMGGLEWVRSRVLVRVSAKIDCMLSERVYNASFKQSLYSSGQNNSAQAIQDLTGLRQFATGNGVFAFFDSPWIPIYLAVMFAFHPWYGWIGVASAAILIIMAIINEKRTSQPLQQANQDSSHANNMVTKTLANAEVIESMGMLNDVRAKWHEKQSSVVEMQALASDKGGTITSMSKTVRMMVQSLILGAGAYLAIQQEITPGLMIAGSILLGRALAPIDQMIGAWKGFVVARAQYGRLNDIFAKVPADKETMSLPAPEGHVDAEAVTIIPPGSRKPVLSAVSFTASPGEVWGIVGPSASGKSCLARAILGVWPTASGKVRIDNADVFAWDRDELGPYIGYLPQDIELFDGSVSQNIARMGEVDPDKVVEAAKAAGVHEMILELPDGYDTVIGGRGGALSGGQRQRIGLARALYGDPVLVVLDEPNSNLDEVGEKALAMAMQGLKQRGASVFVISHRVSILSQVDNLIVLANGQLQMQGPRDEVLAKLKQSKNLSSQSKVAS
ncbi:type I secretion system permease/ATPase [Pseudoalteromonas sp.]|uniref:type I secretion system permease/ATPase n=1 Tax=Pseudoalteromonas sp. TaxID=53249 RepID=UPI00262F909C|nr:type I secretion system permease/ATPase [Pseudoalteromonas sp.]MCP4588749.1 type I secretion system permease/ATPase [Pseudoalteromonas sp.]